MSIVTQTFLLQIKSVKVYVINTNECYHKPKRLCLLKMVQFKIKISYLNWARWYWQKKLTWKRFHDNNGKSDTCCTEEVIEWFILYIVWLITSLMHMKTSVASVINPVMFGDFFLSEHLIIRFIVSLCLNYSFCCFLFCFTSKSFYI